MKFKVWDKTLKETYYLKENEIYYLNKGILK